MKRVAEILKTDNRLVAIYPYEYCHGASGVDFYYVGIGDDFQYQIGDSCTDLIGELQMKHPDVTHTGTDEEGNPYSYIEYGKYSPQGVCSEPWEVM
jgi:hypothetical protein